MNNLILRFLREDTGEDLIEYGLLAAFVAALAVALIIGNTPLKNAITGAFNKAVNALNAQ